MQRNASTDELYFVTLTVIDWIDVFTRRYYNDFIIENLAWCQQNANLNIYAYVIMTNHIHMVANVSDGSLGNVLGRFKSHTSKKLYEMIAGNVQESRRDWVLKAFDVQVNITRLMKAISSGKMAIIRLFYSRRLLSNKKLTIYTKTR
jgi:REP element-mobilizing transposase RayT